MVSGELTIIVSACLIQGLAADSIIQAVLHAQTKAVKSQAKRQFAWQQKLLFKVRDERTIHFWLSDQLRRGEEHIIGECVINLEVMTSEKFPLFLFYKDSQTAIIDVEVNLDSRGTSYIQPQKRTKRLILKFLIRSADLLKNTQLLGSMRPSVRITIGTQSHQTLDSKGKNPVWDQEIIFEGVKNSQEVFFTILDKELIGKDDVVGTARATVESLKTERSYSLDIRSKEEGAGTLKFELKQYYQ